MPHPCHFNKIDLLTTHNGQKGSLQKYRSHKGLLSEKSYTATRYSNATHHTLQLKKIFSKFNPSDDSKDANWTDDLPRSTSEAYWQIIAPTNELAARPHARPLATYTTIYRSAPSTYCFVFRFELQCNIRLWLTMPIFPGADPRQPGAPQFLIN